MYRNKLLSIGFVVLLLLNVIMLAAPLAPVTATPSGTYGSIWVEPDYVNGSLVGYGNTFVVEVKINISETSPDYPDNPGIFAFGYYFTWNDTLLGLISKATYVPGNGVWESGSSVVADSLRDEDGNTIDDTHSYAVTAFGVPTAFTGVMTLAEYTLNVAYEPTLSDASCLLDISEKGFIFSDEEEYPMDVYDGVYEFPVAGPPPTLPLTVEVSSDPTTVISFGKSTITVSVTSDGTPVPGATVTLSSDGGGSFSSVVDNGNGNYTSTFTAPIVSTPTLVNITATVSKTGYIADQGSTSVTVEPGAPPGSPDINNDGIINLLDIRICGEAFWSMAEDDPATPYDDTLRWNPFVDLKTDGLINIFDLWKIAKHYGKTWPP